MTNPTRPKIDDDAEMVALLCEAIMKLLGDEVIRHACPMSQFTTIMFLTNTAKVRLVNDCLYEEAMNETTALFDEVFSAHDKRPDDERAREKAEDVLKGMGFKLNS